MKRLIVWLISLVLAAVFLITVIANRTGVAVHLVPWGAGTELPLSVVMIGSFLFGVVVSFLAIGLLRLCECCRGGTEQKK